METRVFPCRKISAGKAEGELLISKDDICFYLTEPESGKIIEEGHALCGADISDKILVFPSGKGSSSVNLDGLYQLMTHGKCPKAMIVEHADAILVTCAVLMRIPVVDRVPAEFYAAARSGARCEVDADGGRVSVAVCD